MKGAFFWALVAALARRGAAAGDEKAGVVAAKKVLRAVCDDRNTYPFIDCERDPRTGDYVFFAGTFGAGVKAKLYNDPGRFGVKIYADLPVSSGMLDENFEVRPDETKLIPGETFPMIPVYIKTGQVDSMDNSDRYEPKRCSSAFYREKRRSRALAGTAMAPANFDLIRLTPNGGHELLFSENYYVTEFLDATHIAGAFRTVVPDVVGAWTKLAPRLLSSSGKDILKVADSFVREGWWRIRNLLKLSEASLALAARLWKRGFRHCDLHAGNMMAPVEVVPVQSPRFKTLLTRGLAMPADTFVGQLYTGGIDALRASLGAAGITEARMYILHPRRLRLIDLAYLINISARIKAEGAVEMPCRRLTAHRREDTYELRMLLGAGESECRRFQAAFDGVVARAELQRMEGGSAEARMALAVMRKEVRAMVAAYFGAVQAIITAPHWGACIANVDAFNAQIRRSTAAQAAALRENFNANHPEYPCNTATENAAMADAQAIFVVEGAKLEKKMPHGFKVGITGTGSWPSIHIPPGDVSTRFYMQNFGSESARSALANSNSRSASRQSAIRRVPG